METMTGMFQNEQHSVVTCRNTTSQAAIQRLVVPREMRRRQGAGPPVHCETFPTRHAGGREEIIRC